MKKIIYKYFVICVLLLNCPMALAINCKELFAKSKNYGAYLPNSGLGRIGTLWAWGWNRNFGRGEDTFEAQPLENFLAITPNLFKYRPMDQSAAQRSLDVKKYVKESMSPAVAQSIVDYYNNSDLFAHVTPQSQTNLLNRFRNGYNISMGKRSQGAFQFFENLEEGISVLHEYDQLHYTSYALEASLLAIKNFNFGAVRESGHWIFEYASMRTLNSADGNAISHFITALANAPSPEGFGALSDAHLKMQMMLAKLQLFDKGRPNHPELMRVIKRMIYYRLWYAQTNGWSQAGTIIGQGIDLIRGSLEYFKYVWGEYSETYRHIANELLPALQILNHEADRIHREWSESGSSTPRASMNRRALTVLERALGTTYSETLEMPEDER